MLSIWFPRIERRSSLGSPASFLIDDRELISLWSNISVVIVSGIIVDTRVNWFIDADSEVSDGN